MEGSSVFGEKNSGSFFVYGSLSSDLAFGSTGYIGSFGFLG